MLILYRFIDVCSLIWFIAGKIWMCPWPCLITREVLKITHLFDQAMTAMTAALVYRFYRYAAYRALTSMISILKHSRAQSAQCSVGKEPCT